MSGSDPDPDPSKKKFAYLSSENQGKEVIYRSPDELSDNPIHDNKITIKPPERSFTQAIIDGCLQNPLVPLGIAGMFYGLYTSGRGILENNEVKQTRGFNIKVGAAFFTIISLFAVNYYKHGELTPKPAQQKEYDMQLRRNNVYYVAMQKKQAAEEADDTIPFR